MKTSLRAAATDQIRTITPWVGSFDGITIVVSLWRTTHAPVMW
jgi:hypothetical protein